MSIPVYVHGKVLSSTVRSNRDGSSSLIVKIATTREYGNSTDFFTCKLYIKKDDSDTLASAKAITRGTTMYIDGDPMVNESYIKKGASVPTTDIYVKLTRLPRICECSTIDNGSTADEYRYE